MMLKFWTKFWYGIKDLWDAVDLPRVAGIFICLTVGVVTFITLAPAPLSWAVTVFFWCAAIVVALNMAGVDFEGLAAPVSLTDVEQTYRTSVAVAVIVFIVALIGLPFILQHPSPTSYYLPITTAGQQKFLVNERNYRDTRSLPAIDEPMFVDFSLPSQPVYRAVVVGPWVEWVELRTKPEALIKIAQAKRAKEQAKRERALKQRMNDQMVVSDFWEMSGKLYASLETQKIVKVKKVTHHQVNLSYPDSWMPPAPWAYYFRSSGEMIICHPPVI